MRVQQETFDRYAGAYAEKFNRNPLGHYQRAAVQASLLPFLKSGQRLLDVGCGPGSDFPFFKRQQLSVDAIDLSQEMVTLARAAAASAGLAARIFHQTLDTFESSCRYDIILMNFGVINTMENLTEVAGHLQRLCAPQALICVVSMPPFHLWSLLGYLRRGRFHAARERLFGKRATLANGFVIHYYRHFDFQPFFHIIQRRPLAPLLPTPDQYRHSAVARLATAVLQPVDQFLSPLLPELFGGDHICYLMRVR